MQRFIPVLTSTTQAGRGAGGRLTCAPLPPWQTLPPPRPAPGSAQQRELQPGRTAPRGWPPPRGQQSARGAGCRPGPGCCRPARPPLTAGAHPPPADRPQGPVAGELAQAGTNPLFPRPTRTLGACWPRAPWVVSLGGEARGPHPLGQGPPWISRRLEGRWDPHHQRRDSAGSWVARAAQIAESSHQWRRAQGAVHRLAPPVDLASQMLRLQQPNEKVSMF